MHEHHYSLGRPRLMLAILIAVLTLILLALADAMNWFQDEPAPDPIEPTPSVISEEAEK